MTTPRKDKWKNPDTEAVLRAILECKNQDELARFLRDLLTENELIEFGQRFKVAQMLTQKISYTTIEKQTGMSSTTIARIQKWLKNGMGGYAMALERLASHHHPLSSFEQGAG